MTQCSRVVRETRLSSLTSKCEQRTWEVIGDKISTLSQHHGGEEHKFSRDLCWQRSTNQVSNKQNSKNWFVTERSCWARVIDCPGLGLSSCDLKPTEIVTKWLFYTDTVTLSRWSSPPLSSTHWSWSPGLTQVRGVLGTLSGLHLWFTLNMTTWQSRRGRATLSHARLTNLSRGIFQTIPPMFSTGNNLLQTNDLTLGYQTQQVVQNFTTSQACLACGACVA